MNKKLKDLIDETRNDLKITLDDLFNIIEIITDDIEQLKSTKHKIIPPKTK